MEENNEFTTQNTNEVPQAQPQAPTNKKNGYLIGAIVLTIIAAILVIIYLALYSTTTKVLIENKNGTGDDESGIGAAFALLILLPVDFGAAGIGGILSAVADGLAIASIKKSVQPKDKKTAVVFTIIASIELAAVIISLAAFFIAFAG